MIKDVFSKYFSQLLILITVVGVALFSYNLYRDYTEKRKYADLIGTKDKYEQLTRYTAKLESDYRSQKDLAKKAKKDFAEYKKTANERIKLLSDATYLIGKHVEKQDGPDYYYSTPKGTRNYVLNELRISGEESPPIGYVLIKNDGRTYKRNYSFEIRVKNLQTIDEDTGKVRVYAKAFLVQKEPSLLAKRVKGYKDWNGVQYPLDIVGGSVIVDPTEKNQTKKLIWWAPHTNVGMDLGLLSGQADIRPSINFSTSGYGVSRNDLDYKFLHFGLNSSTDMDDFGVIFSPFSYRAFPKYLTNTYIGPGIVWNKQGTGYFIGINLSL